MDGRLMLLASAALMGGVWVFGNTGLLPGPVEEAEAIVPDPVATAHATMRRTLERAGRDLQDPASYVVLSDGKSVVGGPIAATEHDAPAFIGDLVAKYARPVAQDLPGDVIPISSVRGCDPAGPQSGSRVVNIFANASPVPLSFYGWHEGAFSEVSARDLAGEAADGLLRDMRYNLMDVAVTDMDVPVHLVLQTGSGRVLWNLHPVLRAKVTGVTLLGGTLPAVVNLPEDVPIEMMDAEALADCGVAPARLPAANDPLFDDLRAGRIGPEAVRAQLVDLKERAEIWNGWFETHFGMRSDETRVGYDTGALMALAGPVPDSPLLRPIYRGIDGAAVAIGEGAEILAATPEQAGMTLAIHLMSLEEEQSASLPAEGLALASAEGGE